MQTNKSLMLNIRVSQDEREELRRKAQERKASMSDYVRNLLGWPIVRAAVADKHETCDDGTVPTTL